MGLGLELLGTNDLKEGSGKLIGLMGNNRNGLGRGPIGEYGVSTEILLRKTRP